MNNKITHLNFSKNVFGELKEKQANNAFDLTAAVNIHENCLPHVSSVSVKQCGFHHKTHPLFLLGSLRSGVLEEEAI